jgi:hypothetical protein
MVSAVEPWRGRPLRTSLRQAQTDRPFYITAAASVPLVVDHDLE